MVVLLGYLGLVLILVLSIGGPMAAGRWLAEREHQPDPDLAAIEAQALMLLAGPPED